ncbi:hypothetical protein F8S13_21365 [Chloroflexia bacterium SDU3-3]|nr:hypothetical protein F8S13_21365 [Chloroflexia bacterium SDU3-3]
MVRPSQRRLSRAALLALTLACLALLLPARALIVSAADGDGGTVYLPLVSRGQAQTPTPETPTPETPTPDPGGADGALFLQPTKKVGGPAIQVDAQGGMHVAFYDAITLAEHPQATYAYCPPPAAQCADGSKWASVSFSDQVDEVQLQLTPTGHPRMLFSVHDTSGLSKSYVYAECDARCSADAGAWRFATVASRAVGYWSVGSYYLPKRGFALDAQGRPAFVYYDRDTTPEPDHTGGYYYSCQAKCSDAASWTEARFTHRAGYYDELVDQPVLQFTSDGKPRVFAMLYPLDGTGESGLYYFACDSDCQDDASWQRTLVTARGNGPYPAWDLALDAQNRPRASFFKYDADDGSGDTLYYLWCDGSCLSTAGWHTLNLNLPKGEGIGADIELDSAGKPRIAYLTSADLGYAWCDGGCTAAGGWKHGYADNDDLMSDSYPVPLPYTCSSGVWDSYSPSLALDAEGNPRMAYDASYQAYCQFEDPDRPGEVENRFIEVWHSARTVFVPQP